MPIPPGALSLLGSLAQTGGQIFGQHMANKQNKFLAGQQNQQNMMNWASQAQLDQKLWNQQNSYDQKLWQQQNAYAQKVWNQQNQYNEGRWNAQNDYDLQLWHLQNKYNSPQEQMARMRAAGLNPHLMYGKGSVGNANALQSNQQSTEAVRVNPLDSNGMRSPDISPYSRAQAQSVTRGLNTFSDMAQFRNLQAQTNNVEAQTDVAKQEALIKAQDRVLKAVNIKKGKLRYAIDKRLANTTIYAAEENLRQLQNQVRKSAAEADVSVNTKDSRIRLAQTQVRTALETLHGQKLQNELRTIDINLQKHGIQKDDNVLFRILMQPENYKFIEKIPDLLKFGMGSKY